MKIENKIISEKVLINNSKQKKLKFKNEQLYNEKVWKLSFKVVLPSLLISLLFGIYIFIDQILMQHLIPKNGVNYIQQALIDNGWTQEKIDDILKEIYGVYGDSNLSQANKDTIFYQTNIIGTINIIFISVGYFINSGASVLFSRSLAKSDKNEAKKIWISSFYGCLFISLIITSIMLAIQNSVISSIITNPKTSAKNWLEKDQNLYKDVLKFYSIRFDLILKESNNYTYFISSSIPFIMILNLLIFFLRAEGKNYYITWVALIANMFNIVFDILFFMVVKTNIFGGGIATFLGYIINLSLIVGYIVYYEFIKKQNYSLYFGFSDLKIIKIDFKILLISFILSVGTFVRDVSIAVANIVYLVVFINTFDKIGATTVLNDVNAVSGTPIYNLFFFAIYGIVDGLRPMMAYSYQEKKYSRVKNIYYMGLFFSFLFSVLINLIFWVVILSDSNILTFFNATTDSQKEVLKELFMTLMFQFPFLAISISGLSIFQSTGKMTLNFIASLMQGTIIFFPVLFIMSGIAIALDSYHVMLFTGFTNIAISSVTIEIIASIYLFFYMGKKEKYNDPVSHLDLIIKKISNFKAIKKIV